MFGNLVLLLVFKIDLTGLDTYFWISRNLRLKTLKFYLCSIREFILNVWFNSTCEILRILFVYINLLILLKSKSLLEI